MITVDAILFDLDGTLIDSQKDIAASVHFLQEKYGHPPSSQAEVARFIGDGVGKLVERAIGVSDPAELAKAVELFKDHYRVHALDTTYVYDGVHETLEHFRGKKMGVLTNKPVRISKRILEGLGLGEFFPVVLGGDSTARKKPHPDGVHLALQQLAVENVANVLMVGDSAQDVMAGKAAGTRTCGIASNIGDPAALESAKPDFTVRSLRELMRIIN